MNCSSQDLCFSEGLQGELNQDQESAVRAALDCETFHLVHGPPGTGKTRVLAVAHPHLFGRWRACARCLPHQCGPRPSAYLANESGGSGFSPNRWQ